MKPLRERFEAKFEAIPIAGCWVWTASTHEFGYGVIGLGSRSEGTRKAHRVSWELYRGEIPNGLNVLHKCGNAACVNPDHLYLGTLKENTRDMVQMGRLKLPDNRGEKAKWAKLTADQAVHIKQSRGQSTAIALAKKFNVSRSAIYQIWHGYNWRSVKAPE